MIMMNLYFSIISAIMILFLFIPFLAAMLKNKWLEKNISFECGMNMDSNPRKPLSIRFFLLMVLFIIFDIEIVLIIAVPILMPMTNTLMLFMLMLMMLLLVGLSYEWIEGALNWKL